MARKKITEEKETATVEQQRKAEYAENMEKAHNEGLESMASVALGIEPEPQPNTISATEEQVAMLKSEMTRLGIVYKGVIELSF